MSTFCPSPLCPSRIAVTTTSCSFATKLRIHRSYFEASCAETGCKSNLRAAVRGAMTATRSVRRRSIRSMVAYVDSGESCEQLVVLLQVSNECGICRCEDRCFELTPIWVRCLSPVRSCPLPLLNRSCSPVHDCLKPLISMSGETSGYLIEVRSNEW